MSDPLRSSPTGSGEAEDQEHRNESPDQLAPLLESTPAKRGLRDRLKRPRKSDTPSDSDGSLSGGSQGQARRNAAVSARAVSEMGVLQPRSALEPPTMVEPAEQQPDIGQADDSGIKVPAGHGAADFRPTDASGQTAYPPPPQAAPPTSPPTTVHYSPSDVPRDASASSLPLPPALSDLLTPPVTPEHAGPARAAAGAERDSTSPSPQADRPLQHSTHFGSSLVPLRQPTGTEQQASAFSQQFRIADRQAWLEDRQAWLRDRQAWFKERHVWETEREAWFAERQTLISRLQALAAPLPQAMPQPDLSRTTEAGVKAEFNSPPRSAADLLEDVRQSFMKMAPRAFEAGNVMDEDLPSTFPPLSEAEQVELWTKVWDSFDFSDSQRIDVRADWSEQ